ncbi:MAG: hypothetical protein ABFS37_11350 [Acidobacteriota bacterium]
MRYLACFLLTLVLIAPAATAPALTPGTDVLVPAAGRVSTWVTDLYVMNPGNEPTTVTVAWLVRGQANPDPVDLTFTVGPGETLTLPDVILEEFGLSTGDGAFRVTSDAEVVVNSRIYSLDGAETFGQGFEGTPIGLATASGGRTDVVGLSSNSQFRTNVYACAGPDGATLDMVLVAPDGAEIATKTKVLQAWMPFLKGIDQLMACGDFDDGTRRVSVSAGSAVVGASKVDSASSDPTTLEGSVSSSGATDVNGIYQFAIYDSLSYSTGGNLVVEDGAVEALDGTYTNWDKLDGSGDSECTWQFLFGWGLAMPTSLEDLEDGVTFSDDHSIHGLGVLTYTVSLDIRDNLYITGTIDAVGSDFPAENEGCNGTFPQLLIYGGKMPVE